jgi:hypothetical protein
MALALDTRLPRVSSIRVGRKAGGLWEEMVEQNERSATNQNVGMRDSAASKEPGRTLANFDRNRPNAKPEGGLLRELRETPRHLE